MTAHIRTWASPVGTATAATVTLDGPRVAPGNLLLAVVAHARAYAAPLLPPPGWVLLQRIPVGGVQGNLAAAVYARTATGEETEATFTWRQGFLASAGGAATFGGASDALFSSETGLTGWTLGQGSSVEAWRRTIWVPELELYVSVGGRTAMGLVQTSPDGIAWARRVVAAGAWNDVTWSPEQGQLVAVSGTGVGRVITSPDGVTWTERTAAASLDWRGVAWASDIGLYAAVGVPGGAMTSPDGVTWTIRTMPSAVSWRMVRATSGRFVAVASAGVGVRAATSTDGITWASGDIDTNKNWQGLVRATDLNLWLASSSSAGANPMLLMATSPDGVTWTSHTGSIAQRWDAVEWSPELGLAVAVSSDPTNLALNKVQTSPDGINWTQVAGTTGRWSSVTWRPGASAPVAVVLEYSRVQVAAVAASADDDTRSAAPAATQPTGTAAAPGPGLAVALLAVFGAGWDEAAVSISAGYEITELVRVGAITVAAAERVVTEAGDQTATWSTINAGGPTYGAELAITQGPSGLIVAAVGSR